MAILYKAGYNDIRTKRNVYVVSVKPSLIKASKRNGQPVTGDWGYTEKFHGAVWLTLWQLQRFNNDTKCCNRRPIVFDTKED